ncbi:MAG: hypothetical protein IT258_21215 [Saprospiraceae bacterium]|nr:hypothetical protein [Saprospiraceae bacterium]
MEDKISNENQADPMKGFGKIVGVNLAIFGAQVAIVYGVDNAGNLGNTIAMLVGMGMFVTLPVQLLVNLILAIGSFGNKQKLPGIAYLLSIVLVFLIGYSACGGYSILTEGLVH